jgi:hypothetical protein
MNNKPLKNLRWMTKRIKKNNKTHIVSFCPACTARDPWIIHGNNEYTLIRIDMMKEADPIMKQRKQKVIEEWLKCLKEIPYYRDDWIIIIINLN